MRRIRETEVTNQRKWLVVADALDTACIVLATGERVPYITDPTHMTVSEGDRIIHWWSNIGDVAKSAGYLESTVLKKCGRTSEYRWWNLYECDKKEVKHDLEPANYGVNKGAGQCWVWSAAERLNVGIAPPAAAAAATTAAAAGGTCTLDQ